MMSPLPQGIIEKEYSRLSLQRFEKFSKIFILGAGNMGRKTLTVLRQHGISVAGFFENTEDRVGIEIDSVAILSFEEVLSNHGPDCLILIAVYQPGFDAAKAIRQFEDNGFNNVFTIVDLFSVFESLFLPNLFFDKSYRPSDQPQLLDIYNSLSDEASKELLIQTLTYRSTMRFADCPSVTTRAYFPADILPASSLEGCIYVDVGCYDGDTIADFVERTDNFRLIVGFEPDTDNYRSMLRRFSTLSQRQSERIYLHCAAAGTQHGIAPFSYGGGMGSHFDKDSCDYTQVVRLDDFLPNILYQDDYVLCKVDVEGYELAVLAGSIELLQHRKFCLAVSVYHKPDCLVKVWELLSTSLSDARFYLRQHGHYGMDLTLYCMVNK
jgi:FkbM family methyltransferase